MSSLVNYESGEDSDEEKTVEEESNENIKNGKNKKLDKKMENEWENFEKMIGPATSGDGIDKNTSQEYISYPKYNRSDGKMNKIDVKPAFNNKNPDSNKKSTELEINTPSSSRKFCEKKLDNGDTTKKQAYDPHASDDDDDDDDESNNESNDSSSDNNSKDTMQKPMIKKCREENTEIKKVESKKPTNDDSEKRSHAKKDSPNHRKYKKSDEDDEVVNRNPKRKRSKSRSRTPPKKHRRSRSRSRSRDRHRHHHSSSKKTSKKSSHRKRSGSRSRTRSPSSKRREEKSRRYHRRSRSRSHSRRRRHRRSRSSSDSLPRFTRAVVPIVKPQTVIIPPKQIVKKPTVMPTMKSGTTLPAMFADLENTDFKEQLKAMFIDAQTKSPDEIAKEIQIDESKLMTAKEKKSALPLNTLNPLAAMVASGSKATPQQALSQTMAAMHAKVQEITGVAVPKYYNPSAVNPLKYAEQLKKRKMLWSKNKEAKEVANTTEEVKEADSKLPDIKSQLQWTGTSFTADQDGKMAAKFKKLMGIKGEDSNVLLQDADLSKLTEEQRKKQEELFQQLDREYEFARMATHTCRGVGFGFASSHNLPGT